MAAGDIAVNNSPGKLRCNAVIFAVCCEWDNGGARQVGISSHCVRERKRSFLTLSTYFIYFLQFELVATEKAHAQLKGAGEKGQQRKGEIKNALMM